MSARCRASDRLRIHSGNADLDRFFVRYAGENQVRNDIGTIYVAVDEAGKVVGCATAAASELSPEKPPTGSRKRLTLYPIPSLRLTRMAIAESFQGRGGGRLLTRAVLVLAQRMSEEVGCGGAVVDAKAEAIAFYEQLGFAPLDAAAGDLGCRPLPQGMLLELEQIPS